MSESRFSPRPKDSRFNPKEKEGDWSEFEKWGGKSWFTPARREHERDCDCPDCQS